MRTAGGPAAVSPEQDEEGRRQDDSPLYSPSQEACGWTGSSERTTRTAALPGDPLPHRVRWAIPICGVRCLREPQKVSLTQTSRDCPPRASK